MTEASPNRPADETPVTGRVLNPEPMAPVEPQEWQRPGWWTRVRTWFRSPKLPPQPQRHVPRSPALSFSSPSRGDAYDFSVRLRWIWTGGTWDGPTIARDVDRFKGEVWEDIAVAVRCILRTFPPDAAAEAESALNRRLAEITAQKQPSGTDLHWSIRAEVTPHEDVRQIQQQGWTHRLSWNAEQKLALVMVSDLKELTTNWRDLLKHVGIGTEEELAAMDTPPPFIARHLIRLATQSPHKAAEVVDLLAQDRDQRDERLLEAVTGAVNGLDSVNLLEYDVTYDSALRSLMAWAGLPVPPLPEVSGNGSER
ncbi:hypothetical protein GCM10022223_43180 [Kineosporia mesophila]|uniref:Uncharacterized protein n=1 Tax=Kineosporia mesophila TaxID=566012 RepID=A0ABP6ZZT1_9ACTN|nr:hypothetical protein [Kineosporia mesophila]MCD5353245.1 hypothetical protein [Kineosporia mesophila]